MDELKILIVEDLPADAEIAKRSLKKEKIRFISQVVDTAEDFKKALAEFKPNLIISDYSMPVFDGMSALKIARSQPHYIPFILLTGSVNEEIAVACMKAGADDYVLKEKVRRLPFAVNEALQKVEAQKEAEEKLRRHEEKLQSIFRVAPTGIGLTKSRILLEVNPKICEITGYQTQELIGKSARILYPSQKEFELVGKEKYAQIAKQGSGMVETRWQKKDGTILDILLASTAIDASDLSKGVIFTALDFTERKKAETSLRDKEALLAAIYRNAPLVMLVLDSERRIQQVNGFATQFVGRSVEEMLGLRGGDALRCMHALDDPQGCGFGEFCQNCVIRNTVLNTLETGETHLQVEAPFYFQKNENEIQKMTFLASTTAITVKDKQMVLVTLQDITDRKLAEDALRESETKYRLLAETAFDLINFTSVQEIYEYTSRKLFELMENEGIVALVEYGTDSNRWKMKHIEGIHDKLDALVKITGFNVKKLEGEISTKYYNKLISGKLVEVEWDFPEFFNNKVSGKIGKAVRKLLSIDKIYCILIQESEKVFGNITLVTKKNAKPLNVELIEAFVLQVVNFIKKLKAEEALLESEAKYRLLAENSGDVIFTFDFDLNYTYISPAIYALRGYRPEEVINRNLLETLTPASGKKVKQLFEKYIPLIKSGNASAKPLIVELEVLKKDGTAIWVEVKLSVLTDSEGKPKGILGVSRDISERKAAQSELRKLSGAITQSPDSIVITDKDGNIEYVNPKFTQITGYKKEDVLGENPRILNSGEHPKSYYKELWDTILSGNDWHGEFLNKKKNGELYWESASISSLMNNEGEITHFVGVKEDITERKKMEQVQKILFTISVAVVTSRNLDDFFNLIYSELTKVINTKNLFIALYNELEESFSTLFMIDSVDENVDGFPAKNTLSGYVLRKREPQIIDQTLHDELIESSEVELVGPPSEVWIGVPVFDNEKAIGIMVIQNYEGEKTLSREDLKIMEAIAPSIGLAIERKRFVEDLKTEKQRAQAADRLKSAFLNNISHEVRTPLNGILGFSEMLAQPGINENDKASFLKILRISSRRLTNTITDFMDISLIVSKNVVVNKTLFSLHEVLQTLYEQYNAEATEKGLELRLETGNSKISKIETDPELLKKILSHLLDNAIKFTKDGEIHFGYQLKNKQVEFYIQDNGTGIEQEKMDAIFDFFTQGDIGLTRGYEGSGLGLSISKGLVELLGGEISLQSEKGKGTTVSFTLPWAPEETEEETPGNSKQPAAGTLVLIAEDDSMNRLYLETVLKSKGIHYISVENGQQAVEKCRENPEIGLVLMDLKMPVMDGYEATRKIKSFKPELPVIAITAQAMQGDKEKALEAGCDDYIAKPYHKENLLVKVNQNLS
ncbi:PAS domain S-box-containing protein [Tangfeifania diversioriginum]|uniref:histidine kinase n=1 Tax=Tangfeifania diversioriginum TaxID=1168035 RepID=A0A1M6MS46_9BACT|nr:PAS domain S-box protein [Tangfeifania diversioriginum]SHJ86210.1 PAS domain S-box-containing protein [Tangfeifania diversioriginum]